MSVVHDFYEVESARGVYITSVKEDGMLSNYCINGNVTSVV